MPKKGKTKLEQVLQDPEVKRWYDNVARGAITTADIYARRLRSFCEQVKIEPNKLAHMDEKDLYKLILDYVSAEQEKNLTGSYIETTVKSVKSWLSYNQIFIKGKIKISGSRKAPTLENERVPTIDELKRILLVSTPRDRVSCILVAHGGLRLETLGNYKGTDGLRIKDFPEMKIENGEVIFKQVPTIINVREELSKARHHYFTFLSPEGTGYLKQYLEMRLQAGEELGPESDIITPKWADKKFIRTINIGDGIRKSFKAANFKGRPYVLRSFFSTQLLLSESKGKTTHNYREFHMGHTGGVQAKYNTAKGKLPKQLIEDMRESYKRSLLYLQTIHTEDEEKDTIDFRKHILRMSGTTQEEIDQLDVANMDDSDVMEHLRKKLLRTLEENGNCQKVIPLGEVEDYILKGWEYVNNLPDDRAIMKLP